MKLTLLDMVQSILSDLNSDEVNSISDTTESLQVADMVKQSFFNIVARAELPEHNQLFQLVASTNMEQPVLMYRPDNVTKINWIKYFDDDLQSPDDEDEHDIDLDLEDTDGGDDGSAPSYKTVKILPVTEFVSYINQFNTNDSDVESFTFNGITFNFKNDQIPLYCTVLQNYYIIFDGYDSAVDSTLQTSKTQCFGQIIPPFLMEDTFIPEMDDYKFPLLLNEAKALAFLELKQMSHSKAEKEVTRQWSQVQKDKTLADKPSYFDQLPSFGRRGPGWR